jgi:hypothetical protein
MLQQRLWKLSKIYLGYEKIFNQIHRLQYQDKPSLETTKSNGVSFNSGSVSFGTIGEDQPKEAPWPNAPKLAKIEIK